MFVAVDAEFPLTESRVHVMTVMRLLPIRMRKGREMTAGDAHALNRNGIDVLQGLDQPDDGQQEFGLPGLVQTLDGHPRVPVR